MSAPDPRMRWWGWGIDADAMHLPASAQAMIEQGLGVEEAHLRDHIAWDIGIEAVTRAVSERLVLHEFSESGNCYKIRLTAALLGTPIELRQYDITKGETRTPEFMANVNANGRIPVLQVGERFITESNAASGRLDCAAQLRLTQEQRTSLRG